MPKSREEAIASLAGYLTAGSRVANASIALEIGGARKTEADAFFALRDALGIGGYLDAEGAVKAIKATLAE